MLRLKALRRRTPARFNGRSADQALQAVPVERAYAVRIRRLGHDLRHHHVADLRVKRAMMRRPTDQHAPADASAHRDINERVASFSVAPVVFPERRRIHIRVESDRHMEALLHLAEHVRVFPALLRRGRDVAVGVAGGCKSSGPKQPTPMALMRPCWRDACSRKSMTSCRVSFGDVVSMRTWARMSSGPVPRAQLNLVPPASIAAMSSVFIQWYGCVIHQEGGIPFGHSDVRLKRGSRP